MFEYILGTCFALLVGGLSYLYYYRYTDVLTELFTYDYNNVRCIKYHYRGKKYIYLTDNLTDTINVINKELDLNSTEKDKPPATNFKCILIKLTDGDYSEELRYDYMPFIYSLMGPANTYYFAFDTKFNNKLTVFMNHMFDSDEGALVYGRFSALLSPQKYFEIKNKLNEIKKEHPYVNVQWEFA
jgi:hypothetical protein